MKTAAINQSVSDHHKSQRRIECMHSIHPMHCNAEGPLLQYHGEIHRQKEIVVVVVVITAVMHKRTVKDKRKERKKEKIMHKQTYKQFYR